MVRPTRLSPECTATDAFVAAVHFRAPIKGDSRVALCAQAWCRANSANWSEVTCPDCLLLEVRHRTRQETALRKLLKELLGERYRPDWPIGIDGQFAASVLPEERAAAVERERLSALETAHDQAEALVGGER